MGRSKKTRRPGSRLAVLLLALCMIVTMMPLAVFAAPDTEGDPENGAEAVTDVENPGAEEDSSEEAADGEEAGSGETAAGEEAGGEEAVIEEPAVIEDGSAVMKTEVAGWADGTYVLGRQVSSSNCDDVLEDGGSVKYNRDAGTLTLNNAVIDIANYKSSFTEFNSVSGIYTWDELTLVLEGSNVIRSSAASFDDNIEYVYGITTVNELSITGEGSLNIEINSTAETIEKYYGIESTRRLVINGCALDVAINGDGVSYGISTGWKGFSITGGSNVKVVSTEGSNWAVYDSSYKKSTVGDASSLEMFSDYGAIKYSVLSDSMTECDVLVNTEASSDNAADWDKTTRLDKYRYVKITAAESESRGSGKVYILGKEINDGEVSADIPHTGTIEFDSSTNTLYMTDASIDLDDFGSGSDGNAVIGIYALSDIRIVLSGSNSIYASRDSYASGKEYVVGVEGLGSIAFTGDTNSSLSVALAGKNSANSDIEFIGIESDGSTYVDKISLTVDMGKYGRCTGVYAWDPIILSNGAWVSVNADGSKSKAVSGVNAIGKSEVNDSSTLIMSSDGSAFYCWSPGSSLKATEALVGDSKDGTGAVAWDGTSALYEYKYVKFTGPDEGEGGRFGDDIRILGRKIDEDNCNDVLGDGTVKFDLENNVLTLTDAQLDLKDFHHEYDDDEDPDSGCNYVAGIRASRTISIVLNGENKIYSSVSEYDAKKQYVFGIQSGVMNDLSISGTGSLDITLTKDNEALCYYGIETGNNFTVDNAAVTVDLAGTLKGTGIDVGFNNFTLKNGATVKVTASGESSTGVYYVMASGMSMDNSSMFEMTSDGKAFNCYSVSDEVKQLGALVNDISTSEGAAAWDKTTMLTNYKYVRFPEVYIHTHTITHVEAKNATCDEQGNAEYWVCSGCGKYFTGEDGETETDPPEIYPVTGHNWGDWESISDEEHQRVCANDESHKETAAHTWDDGKITKKATLLTKGEKVYTCTTCSRTRTEKFSYIETIKENIENSIKKIKEWLKKIFGIDEITDVAETDSLEVNLSETMFTYNGEVQRPEVVSVMLGDTKLDEDNYSVEYSDPSSRDVGSYSVKVSVGLEGLSVSEEAADNYISKTVQYSIMKDKNGLSEGDTASEGDSSGTSSEDAAGTSGNSPGISSGSVAGSSAAPTEVQDLPSVKIRKISSAKKAFTVNWKKVTTKNQKKIGGIEIQVATDPGFTNIVKNPTAGKKKTSKKIKGSSKTTYYVRVRSYKNINGVKHVSAWSGTKKVKTK